MHFKSSVAVIAGIGVLLVMGCVRQTEVVKLYEDPANTQTKYQKLLVVSIADERRAQENFENAIAEELRQHGIDAVPSHTIFAVNQGLQQEDLNLATEQTGADGLLITHVSGIDSTTVTRTGREDAVLECRGGNPVDLFEYDNEELREPDSVRMSHTVTVMANLYAVGTFERMWGIQSTCFDKATMSEVIVEEAEAIARQLQIDQLI